MRGIDDVPMLPVLRIAAVVATAVGGALCASPSADAQPAPYLGAPEIFPGVEGARQFLPLAVRSQAATHVVHAQRDPINGAHIRVATRRDDARRPGLGDSGVLRAPADGDIGLYSRRIAAADRTVAVTWTQARRQNAPFHTAAFEEAYLAMSSDGGVNWSTPQRVSDLDTLGTPQEPEVAVGQDAAFIVFNENGRFVEVQRSGGGLAVLRREISSTPARDYDVAHDGSNRFVAWVDRDGAVRVRGPWGERLVSEGSLSSTYGLRVVASEGLVAATWTGTKHQIFTAISRDDGHSWETDEVAGRSESYDDSDALAIAGRTVLAWQEYERGAVKVARAPEKTFGAPVTIGFGSRGYPPRLAAQRNGKAVAVTWTQMRTGPITPCDRAEARLAVSVDEGQTFAQRDPAITRTPPATRTGPPPRSAKVRSTWPGWTNATSALRERRGHSPRRSTEEDVCGGS